MLFCIELDHEFTYSDIVFAIMTNNKQLFECMIMHSSHLDVDLIYCIKYDNLEFFKLLTTFKDIVTPTSTNKQFLSTIKQYISQHNAINICDYLLNHHSIWWHENLTRCTMLFHTPQFQYNCIKHNSIDVLKIIGLQTPCYLSNMYKADLIKLSLKYNRYEIIKFINEN